MAYVLRNSARYTPKKTVAMIPLYICGASLAQLAARQSHNLKVVSSTLIGGICLRNSARYTPKKTVATIPLYICGASLAQSAARQSHNLKVVSSTLIGGICFAQFS